MLTLGLPSLLPRHTFSAVSFLAHVQHRISLYGLVVVGVWLVRISGRAGLRIEQRRATLDFLATSHADSCAAR